MKLKLNDYKAEDVARIMREWTGKTQPDFGKIVGLKKNSISKIENGKRNIYLKTFIKWAKLNKINIIMTKDEND